jgi:hypothetical protein
MEGAVMPYFKCTPCRLRVSAAGPEMDVFDGRCPSCGDRLTPVRQLMEVVGFRSCKIPVPSADPGAPEDDLGRWADEGGSLAMQAVALRAPPDS